MPLEPTTEAAGTLSGSKDVDAAFEAAILGTPEPTAKEPEAPAPAAEPPAPEPPAPEPAPTDLPPAEPEPAKWSKLPIEEDDPTPEPEPKGDKAGYRIQELKTEIASTWKPKVTELEQERERLAARITELEGVAAKAEELERKASDYEKEMAVVRLEKNPVFQKQVAEPLKKVQDRAFEIAWQYEIDRAKLVKAFETSDETERKTVIREMLSGLDVDQEDAFELRSLIREAQPLLDKQDEAYRHADAALLELQALTERQSQQAAAESAEARRNAAPLVVEKMARWLPAVKDFASEAAKAVETTDPGALPVDHQVFNHMAGLVLPKLGKLYAQILRERDELLDEVTGYRNTTPGTDHLQGSTPTRPADPTQAFLQAMGAM